MKAKKLTSEEVCRELQIEHSELMALRKNVDGALLEKEKHPDHPSVQRLLWGPEAMEKLRSLLEERRREEARWNGLLTTREVCRLLEVSPSKLLQVRAFLGSRVSPEKSSNRLGWSREAVEVLRAGLRARAVRPVPARIEDGRLSSLEVAEELGIDYQRLMNLRKRAGNELPRARGERAQLRWQRDEAEKLRRLKEEHREREEAREAARHGEIVAALRKCSLDARDVSERIERLLRSLKVDRACGAVIIHTLPDRRYTLAMPLTVSIFPGGDRGFVASLPEVGLEAEGSTRAKAVQSLRRVLVQAYLRMRRSPGAEPDLGVLGDLIVEKAGSKKAD